MQVGVVPVADRVDLSAELERITDELAVAHPEVPTSKVRLMVDEFATSLSRSAKITEFIPVLVRNQVGTALRRNFA